VDFDALSDTFRALEAEYAAQLRDEAAASQHQNRELIVREPRVLCVSSAQYLKLGFANQLQTVLDAFPQELRHDVATSSKDVVGILSTQQVDVVHIAAYVCPRSGTLYFSHVELPLGVSTEHDEDFIRAEALAVLLEGARTRLVVIASGDSLALATVLLPLTNVISPRDIISAKAMAVWVRTFYTTLRTQTLAEACELAAAQSQASMKLLTQQVPSPIKLTWEVGGEPSAAKTG
jgi:CHAT domain-containing protein